MRFTPRRLRGRLLLANLVVAGAALGTVLVGVSLIGPGYFEDAMGHRPGDPMAQQMDALTLRAFQEAIRTALLAAAGAALAAAVVVSLALSSRIADPVSRLVSAARRIAGGHYAERVATDGEGEVAELAAAFNLMSAGLEATERRRLQLVGDVAHELRTPLSTLDGYLEGLEDGVIEPKPPTWQLLRRETGRLMRLVGDLQELWRAEARELHLHASTIDLRELLSELAQGVGSASGTSESRAIVSAETGITALADRDRVVQILANYLSNALRYSPPGSPVTLGAERASGEVRAWVRDEGPGLTRDQLAHVFERFFRLDASRSRKEGGSGIGLAIVRALAEAMGGRAWAESSGVGHGSTFFVALPAAGPGPAHGLDQVLSRS